MIILLDDFGNTATIETKLLIPYKECKEKQIGWILTISADYDNDFVYFRAVYETEKRARQKVNEFSCGNWREV